MQALMLAAGKGSRLGKFTQYNTKCMVEVAGRKLIDRAIEAVTFAGIKRFILVIGYKGENLKNYIIENYKNCDLEFIFIDNVDYENSNNIYSFYMAKEFLLEDDTILLESDLIYEKELIKNIVDTKDKNLVAVAKYESWMDGTVVILDKDNCINQFVSKIDMSLDLINLYYKTVNVYKFSKEFFKSSYLPFLEAYIKAYGLNSYYETVLKVIAHLEKSSLKAYLMNDAKWYEIDDSQDLDISNVIFATGKEKYNNITSKFGGYWRYNNITDFCYLVNPHFPPQRMIEKMQGDFQSLLTQYPSGLNIQNMNAERMFGVNQNYLLVGNGAAELINALGIIVRGKVAVNMPTFNEYVRCFRDADIIEIDNSINDYRFDMVKLKQVVKEVNYLCIVSPDNPSGAMLSKDNIEELCELAQKHGTTLVLDESFVDFADEKHRFTMLNDDVLAKYPNLCVIKSVSKSYGVPALRLGVLASSNKELIANVRKFLPVWNINSFAEYYLQIYPMFAKDYISACDKIVIERNRLYDELSKISDIKVYKSQANYLLINLNTRNAFEFCVKMLNDYNILIKDLSAKKYFEGNNYIRVAIRNEHDNNWLIECMNKELWHKN